MGDLSGLGEPWAKIRAQYNVLGGMGIVEAVDHIVAESSRRRALYKENCRRSCSLPVVAMFSKEPQASSHVMDIVSGLDWARIRVRNDVIVAAQNAGILVLSSPNGSGKTLTESNQA